MTIPQIGILADRYRVFLTSRVEGRGDYYNAAILSVRRRTDSFLRSVICPKGFLVVTPHKAFVLIFVFQRCVFLSETSICLHIFYISTILVAFNIKYLNSLACPLMFLIFFLATMLISQVNKVIYVPFLSNPFNNNKIYSKLHEIYK